MPVNLPTTLLRSFVAIVDSGSMLGATGRVALTQSALSLQIKRLEELLQQTLFHREGRRLSLTPEGTQLLDYARRLLALHDEAVAAVGKKPGPPGESRRLPERDAPAARQNLPLSETPMTRGSLNTAAI